MFSFPSSFFPYLSLAHTISLPVFSLQELPAPWLQPESSCLARSGPGGSRASPPLPSQKLQDASRAMASPARRPRCCRRLRALAVPAFPAASSASSASRPVAGSSSPSPASAKSLALLPHRRGNSSSSQAPAPLLLCPSAPLHAGIPVPNLIAVEHHQQAVPLASALLLPSFVSSSQLPCSLLQQVFLAPWKPPRPPHQASSPTATSSSDPDGTDRICSSSPSLALAKSRRGPAPRRTSFLSAISHLRLGLIQEMSERIFPALTSLASLRATLH